MMAGTCPNNFLVLRWASIQELNGQLRFSLHDVIILTDWR